MSFQCSKCNAPIDSIEVLARHAETCGLRQSADDRRLASVRERFTPDEIQIAAVAIAGLERLYGKLLAREGPHDDRLVIAIQQLKRIFQEDPGAAPYVADLRDASGPSLASVFLDALAAQVPVTVCLEDAAEVDAFDLVQRELADFKRAIDTTAGLLGNLPPDAALRVVVAAATAVGFAPEMIAGFQSFATAALLARSEPPARHEPS